MKGIPSVLYFICKMKAVCGCGSISPTGQPMADVATAAAGVMTAGLGWENCRLMRGGRGRAGRGGVMVIGDSCAAYYPWVSGGWC